MGGGPELIWILEMGLVVAGGRDLDLGSVSELDSSLVLDWVPEWEWVLEWKWVLE